MGISYESRVKRIPECGDGYDCRSIRALCSTIRLERLRTHGTSYSQKTIVGPVEKFSPRPRIIRGASSQRSVCPLGLPDWSRNTLASARGGYVECGSTLWG